MRTYHYTPSVYAYVAVKTKDGEEYYDLTEDIVSCDVNRVCDNFSTFGITLLNRGLKYNGLFSPFDRITIFASKGGEKIRLLTGYITKTDVFTLYEQNFKISGADTLYRLSQLWFDPSLHETGRVLSEAAPAQIDNEGWKRLYVILTKIAGWPEDMIKIEQAIPMSVVNWARKLYVAQKSDYEQSEQIMQEMFQAIMSTSNIVAAYSAYGPTVTGNTSGGEGKAANPQVEKAVQYAIAVANDDTHGYNLYDNQGNPDYCCASLITAAFSAAGFPINGTLASTGMMKIDFENHGFRFIEDSTLKGIQRGDVIIISGHEHTELYIGGGQSVGALNNYDGRQGDSSGREISINTYNRDKRGFWGYLHYEGV